MAKKKKVDQFPEFLEKEIERHKRVNWILEFLKWGSIILEILFFLWLANQFGWI